MSFASLSLSPDLIGALPRHLKTPTDIQTLAIPELLNNKDLLALANTGSGKTLAFGLPLLERLHGGSTKALILAPTRELALQIESALSDIARPLGVKTICLCGGVDKSEQIQTLQASPQLLVATTGRLLELINEDNIDLTQVKHLILDEADRLLDMGFWPDIQSICKHLSSERQTALFSATFSERLKGKAAQIQCNPVEVSVHQENSVNEQVSETLYLVNKGSKTKALIELIKQHQWPQVLVFISAKEDADKLTKKLVKAGITAAALHGNKSQQERQTTLSDFMGGRSNVLIATDVLARGVDIQELPAVVNFELPMHAEVYVHRVGRTARAGRQGVAISLVCHGESEALNAIRALTKRALAPQGLAGFPVTDKPSSGESKRAPRDKKANRRTNNKKSIKQFKGGQNRP